MNLIPPTHGRAGVRTINARGYLAQIGEEGVRRQMLSNMNRLYRDEFGVDVPESWLSWEVVESPTEVDIRLAANAPTRGRTYVDAYRGTTRTAPIAVTTASSIPIVPTSYRYEDTNPFRRDDHVLTFAGWDAETGLMVFDR